MGHAGWSYWLNALGDLQLGVNAEKEPNLTACKCALRRWTDGNKSNVCIYRRHGQDLVQLLEAFLCVAWVCLLQKGWRLLTEPLLCIIFSLFIFFKHSLSLVLSPGYSGSISNCPGFIWWFISGMAIHILPTVFMGGRDKGERCRRWGNNVPASYVGMLKTPLYSLLVFIPTPGFLETIIWRSRQNGDETLLLQVPEGLPLCALLVLSGDTFKSIIITETGTNCNAGLVECPEMQTVQKRT